MTSAYLQQWIQHPEMLNKDTLYELRTSSWPGILISSHSGCYI